MKAIQAKVKKYLVDRGWNKLSPADIAKSIAIEAGEVLEIFQWSNPNAEELKKNSKKMTELKKEIADVIIYCLDMAVILDIDAGKAVEEKLALIEKKYPAEEMKGKVANDRYWEIKNQYRKKGIN